MAAVLANHEMATGAAPGEPERPALALVNSRRNAPTGPIDDLASTSALRGWLADHDVLSLGTCDGAALRSVQDLRDAIRELLLARIEGRIPDPGSVHVVNQAASAAPTARQLDWPSTAGPSERRDCLGANGIALARALLAADAIDLVVGPDHTDLRACGAPGCLRLMLKDHPRRRWCCTRCGDRVRARRYYHRHRSTSGGADR